MAAVPVVDAAMISVAGDVSADIRLLDNLGAFIIHQPFQYRQFAPHFIEMGRLGGGLEMTGAMVTFDTV